MKIDLKEIKDLNITQVLMIGDKEFLIIEVISLKNDILTVKGTFVYDDEVEIEDGLKIITVHDYNIHTFRFTEDVIEYSYFGENIKYNILDSLKKVGRKLWKIGEKF